MSPTYRETGWLQHCCVPAFIGQAVATLSGHAGVIDEEDMRRNLAKLMGVTLGPTDFNPWGLPTSSDEADWGVPLERVRESFASVKRAIASEMSLVLDIIDINEITFEMYEDAVVELVRAGAVIGIAFDYAELQKTVGLRSVPSRRAHHVVRLTPLGSERRKQPTILSPAFKFDYSGDIWVFDDCLEMREEESLVGWRALVQACRSIDGAFWAVRPS